jgi:hypothetical protein
MSRWRSTGFGVFGARYTGMSLITNLVTDSPEQWPRVLQPIAASSPTISAELLVVVRTEAGRHTLPTNPDRPQPIRFDVMKVINLVNR